MNNFLDAFPQDWTNEAYEELRKALVSLAFTGGEPELQELAQKAGIAFGTFPFGLNLGDIAKRLIEVMGKQGKLRKMVEVASKWKTISPEAREHFAAMLRRAEADGAIVPITNSIGMKLMSLPAGTFTMGSPTGEDGRDENDEQQVRVRITKRFLMGVYQVTQAEYERVAGTNPSRFSRPGEGVNAVADLDTSRFPVESVTWNDAVKFCDALSALPDGQAAGYEYRLPTEAEWEYACRAGTTGPFHFGCIANGWQATCDGTRPYGGTNAGPEATRPTPVGKFTANAFGLYDMHGNVWEWCSDWWQQGYYANWAQWSRDHGNQPYPDPQGPDKARARVIRGGSWQDLPEDTRSAKRCGGFPDEPSRDTGFRVAATLISHS